MKLVSRWESQKVKEVKKIEEMPSLQNEARHTMIAL